MSRERIAVVGTGISGLVAARLLHAAHDVTVFEAGDRVGGHTNTVDVALCGSVWPVDTGFIVFNDRTYPSFVRLLGELGVRSQPTTMSFSVRCERTGLEYCGSSPRALFAQRRNLLRPSFWWMLREILRFHREGRAVKDVLGDDVTLAGFLTERRYGRAFVEHYVVPMGAAIWSAAPGAMAEFPAAFFLRFLDNHGMLSVRDRPTWRVVSGGSRRYVERLIAPFADRIRLRTPVLSVRRPGDRVEVASPAGIETYDQVVLATHSDQALRLLADPSPAERAVLGAIPYQRNEAVLHTDATVLPRRHRARAAWNYRIPRDPRDRVAVTYHMNTLQGLDAPVDFLVSLGLADEIEPARVLRRIAYEHPVFTPAGVAARERKREVNGVRRTWYCGAWWGFGFHEDGVVSALEVARRFGLGLGAAA